MGKKVYEWDAVPAGNNFSASSGGWPEGMARSDVNNAARENLSDIRNWYNDMEWQKVHISGPEVADVGTFARVGNTSFTITLAGTDLTSQFPAGRMLQFYNSSNAVVGVVTQVVSSSYSSNVTTVNTTNSSPKFINATAAEVRAFFSKSAKTLALADDVSTFYIPATADSAGIQAAVDEASAAGGGTVLLTAATYDITTQINVTGTNGSLIIQGALPSTVVKQSNSNNGNQLFYLDNASELISFYNIEFDANLTNQSSGNSRCFTVAGNIGLTFRDCIFSDCKRAVHFSGTTGTRIAFNNCHFKEYTEYGIVNGGGNTSSHTGVVTNCYFDGNSITLNAGAAVHLSGRWIVSDNRFVNHGHSSITKYSIFGSTKSGTGAGFNNSTISGNLIDNTNGVNGFAIGFGGDKVIVSWNKLKLGSNGTGIYLNTSAAGVTIDESVVSGNNVTGGYRGVVFAQRVSGALVTGNNCNGTDRGILNSGLNTLIEGNLCKGGSYGISCGSTSEENSVTNNLCQSQSTAGIQCTGDKNHYWSNRISGTPTQGFLISSASSNAVVVDNYVESTASALIANTSTSFTSLRNTIADTVMTLETDLGSYSTGSSAKLLVGVAHHPGEVAQSGGRGTFDVRLRVTNNSSRSITWTIYSGPLGTDGDTQIGTGTVGGGMGTTLDHSLSYSSTNSLGKLSLYFQDGGGTGTGVNATSVIINATRTAYNTNLV